MFKNVSRQIYPETFENIFFFLYEKRQKYGRTLPENELNFVFFSRGNKKYDKANRIPLNAG